MQLDIWASKKPFAVALMMALPAPGLAGDWSCHFATECYDADCAESGYTASIRVNEAGTEADGADLTATLEDDAESYPLTGNLVSGAWRLASLDNATGARLLTIWPDGTAHYVTHITDPAMAISYAGTCEEVR